MRAWTDLLCVRCFELNDDDDGEGLVYRRLNVEALVPAAVVKEDEYDVLGPAFHIFARIICRVSSSHPFRPLKAAVALDSAFTPARTLKSMLLRCAARARAAGVSRTRCLPTKMRSVWFAALESKAFKCAL